MSNWTPRHKKALSNAMLVHSALSMNTEITFFKSKRSLYAPKVLRGLGASWGGPVDGQTKFMETSVLFCAKMQKIIENARHRNQNTLNVSIKTLNEITEIDNTLSQSTINDSVDGRTKESAFTNYLAYNLIQRGAILTTKTSGLKRAKDMHFYIWEKIVLNDGSKLCISDVGLLLKLIDVIEDMLKKKNSFSIDYVPCTTTSNSQSPFTVMNSAFKPVDRKEFIVETNYEHPYLMY
ncbi:Uncharacterized protein QTN25_004147 [Entamoeba marina]